jgi:hypothetical protein
MQDLSDCASVADRAFDGRRRVSFVADHKSDERAFIR